MRRVASILSRILSVTMDRSNSEKAIRILRNIRPDEVLVLISCVTEQNLEAALIHRTELVLAPPDLADLNSKQGYDILSTN